MAGKYICFVLFVIFIPRHNSKRCILRTESDEFKSVCCSDYEAKDDDCIACSSGYTSQTGQKCRPCYNNTYGERCRFDCSCSIFEMCDIVEGCVENKKTSGTAADETSDVTTSPNELYGSSHGQSSNKTHHRLLSTEIIVIITLSVVVAVFGVCLCFIFYKYKLATTRKKTTILQLPDLPLPKINHAIEIEERFYDIINEADMLDDQQVHQMQIMSSEYLDVVSSLNRIEKIRNTKDVNNDIQCQICPSDKSNNHESKNHCNSLVSVDTTSSSSEDNQETTQDYLNPYQSVIETSPTTKVEYLTLATVHKQDRRFPYFKTFSMSQNEFEPLKKHTKLRLNEYENHLNNFECTDPKSCLSNVRKQVSMSCETLNDKRQTNINSKHSTTCKNSYDKLDYYNIFKTKSESDIFCNHVLQK